MSEDHKPGTEAPVELSTPKDRSDAAPVTDDAPLPGYVPDRPSGWMYKGFRIFGTEIWYASPKVQLLMVAFVCFLCPGMFNALSGLGGGGQIDPTIADHAATALYSTFAVVGFFAGTIANRIGLRITLSLGGVGYCIYSASFLAYNIKKGPSTEGFVIFAGTLLGVCAGLLWTAQGAIMMSYPPESSKGRYISWFWIIFNFGAVVGSLVCCFH
jgi:MFS family permease